MNKKYLESSEFYSTRFNNFSTMIIIPIFVLFIGVVLFSFIGKREINVNGVGTIQPEKVIANVQTTVNGKITYSALREGRLVNKGQILLQYSNQSNKNKLSLYQDQRKFLKEQIADLSTLRKGIESNSDSFTYNDKFGYRDSLNDYLDQRNTYLLNNEQIRKEYLQHKKIDISGTYAIKENNQKIKILQLKELQENSQDLVKARSHLKELDVQLDNLNIGIKDYTVKAPKSGILHINDAYKSNKYINPGVEIAQIYPAIKNQKYVQLKSYVQASDISSVKKGQEMRFKVIKNVPKPITLSGKINNISVTSLNSDKGSYYCVTSLAKITPEQAKNLKYGMNGSISIITGRTTFFEYYKDKILGND